jgi:hypothetical protein
LTDRSVKSYDFHNGSGHGAAEKWENAMIAQLHGFPDNVVAFAGRGQVTKVDYVSILIPAVEKALVRHDRIRLYYELGADFRGIDADALVEDFKIGMQHLARWERAAVVTDVQWIAHAVSLQLSDARRDQGLFDEERR